jgi:hypothetical protein
MQLDIGQKEQGRSAAPESARTAEKVIPFNAILREAEASCFHPRAELSCRTAADPPVWKPSKSFGRNGSSTSGDAFLTLSAAVVAAVTRNT